MNKKALLSIIACQILLYGCSAIRSILHPVTGSKRADQVAADQAQAIEFASQYFETPVHQFRQLRGNFQPGLGPLICFESDQPPKLKDAAQYKNEGDSLGLTDRFVSALGNYPWCLYHPADVTISRMIENGGVRGAQRRWLLAVPTQHKYFFYRGTSSFHTNLPDEDVDVTRKPSTSQGYYARACKLFSFVGSLAPFNEYETEEGWPKAIDLAISDLTKAIAMTPDFACAYELRGVCLMRRWLSREQDKKELDAAISDLNTASKLVPTDSDPHFFLMCSYANRGDIEQARKELELVVKLGDDLGRGRARLEQVLKDQAAVAQKQ